jgi:tRNA-2-methylthio-N6-dimethylallyladenosine synthase
MNMKNDIMNEAPEKEPYRQYYFMAILRKQVKKLRKKLGRPLTFCTQTFGCQMNAKDSEKLAGILEEIGYVSTDTEEADFVIYNTCTVRENANLKVYGRLGYLGSLKKKNPNMLIAICGCMMQEAEIVEKIKKSYPFVDIIFGTHNIFKLAELMYAQLYSDSMIIDVWKDTNEIVEDLPSERKYQFKAGVNIMYGCNNFCSYCIVPYVRGRERSRNPEDIVKEIEGMVADGVVEITLLGQNVNSYGKTLENPMTFAKLLSRIEKIEGLRRIRFMTSHPKDLSDELIEVMKNSKKICNHLHLPLQSGSTRLLKIMNRKYTKEEYLDLARRIKKAIPNISMTTDIIVGFPGETEEDFLETIDVVRKVKFDSAYTFQYSKRTGTPAATMEEQVEPEVVKKRFGQLLKEIQEISANNTLQGENSISEVLVEEINSQDSSFVTGRLGNNVLVHFKGDSDLIGKVIMVKLVECKGFYYMGEMI